MKTSELLRKAADEIRRRGWWQGDFAQPDDDIKGWYADCPVCLWGGLNSAASGDRRDPYFRANAQLDAAYAVLAAAGCEDQDIGEWNDRKGRTVEKVADPEPEWREGDVIKVKPYIPAYRIGRSWLTCDGDAHRFDGESMYPLALSEAWARGEVEILLKAGE